MFSIKYGISDFTKDLSTSLRIHAKKNQSSIKGNEWPKIDRVVIIMCLRSIYTDVRTKNVIFITTILGKIIRKFHPF